LTRVLKTRIEVQMSAGTHNRNVEKYVGVFGCGRYLSEYIQRHTIPGVLNQGFSKPPALGGTARKSVRVVI